jgi:hypothetical protein
MFLLSPPPEPLMEQHMATQDIAWQIVGDYSPNLQNLEHKYSWRSIPARAKKPFPKIEDFEVKVQHRYISSML